MPLGASGYDFVGSYSMVKKWVPVGASRCDLSNQCIFVFRIVGASGGQWVPVNMILKISFSTFKG